MKLEWFRKKNGAVSVFLAIVLVPIICLSTVYVDLSRVKQAKASAAASGELALNTLMTNYDIDLNDFYGMMGSVQNIEDYYDAVEDYFKIAIKSQGIDASDADSYASDITGIISGETDDISDFLKMDLAEDSSLTVSGTPNADLANPAMMKNNIVEFMKYRSPINAAKALIDMLKGSSNDLESASNNTKLLDDKQDYYQDQEAVMQDLYDLHEDFKAYQALGITKQKVEDIKNSLDSAEDDYKELHDDLVKNLYNFGSTKRIKIHNLNPNNHDIYEYDDNNKTCNTDAFQNRLKDLGRAIQKYQEKKKALQDTINQIDKTDKYDVQYWIHLYALSSLDNSIKEYCAAYCDVSEARTSVQNGWDHWTEKDAKKGNTYPYPQVQKLPDVDIVDNDTYENYFNKLTSQADTLMNDVKANNGFFKTFQRDMNKIYSDNADNVDQAKYSEKVKAKYDKYNEYVLLFESGRTILADVSRLLTKLDGDLTELEESEAKWEQDSATYSGSPEELKTSSIKKFDQAFYDNVTHDTVRNLSGRNSRVDTLLKELIEAFDEIKYQDTKILDIQNYNDMLSALNGKQNVDKEKLVVNNTQLSSYSDSIFSFTNTTSFSSSKINSNNNPDFDENEEKLYVYIRDKESFEKPDADMEEGQAEREDYENQTGETAGDAKDATKTSSANASTYEIKDQPELASSNSYEAVAPANDDEDSDAAIDSIGSDVSGASNFISNMFDGLTEILYNIGTTVRDDIYTVDYITSNFSFDTMEKEAKVNGKKEAEKKGETFDESSLEYKTLTLKDINAENNKSYLNEVEYILYGGSNAGNKAKAYGTIFLMRFALDLPAVLTRYYGSNEDADAVLAIAELISGLTYGIVPAELIRLTLIILIDVLEALCDLMAIKDGKKVILVKTKDEHLCISFNSISDGIDGLDASTKGTDNDIKLAYSDYLKIILFLKLLGGSSADRVYQRTADVIQVNMQGVKNDDSFRMKKCICYFDQECTVLVDSTMLSQNLVRNLPGNPYQETGWRTFTYKCTRGY